MTHETQPTSEKSIVSTDTTSKNKKSLLSVFILWTILLLILAGGAVMAWQWKIWQTEQSQQMRLIKKQFAKLQLGWIETQAQIVNQAHDLNTLTQMFQQDRQENGALARAQHLVKMAVFHLSFEHDVNSALALLYAADDQLQSEQNPGLLSVRKAIAEDIMALKSVPELDVAGIAAEIDAISLQVGHLKQIPLTVPGMPSGTAIPALTGRDMRSSNSTHPYLSLAAKKIRQFSQAIMNILKNMLIIRHNVPDAEPLLPPDQYAYVTIGVQAQLALAKWGLLHQQPDIYQKSLQQAMDWIKRYYPSGSIENTFLKQLYQLSQTDIKPELPDLTQSLESINQALKPSL